MYIKTVTVKWDCHRFINLKMKHCMLLVPLFVVASIGMGRDRQYSERLVYFTLLLCVHCTRSSTWNLKQSAGFTVPLVFFCTITISRFIAYGTCLLYLYTLKYIEIWVTALKSCLIWNEKLQITGKDTHVLNISYKSNLKTSLIWYYKAIIIVFALIVKTKISHNRIKNA